MTVTHYSLALNASCVSGLKVMVMSLHTSGRWAYDECCGEIHDHGCKECASCAGISSLEGVLVEHVDFVASPNVAESYEIGWMVRLVKKTAAVSLCEPIFR